MQHKKLVKDILLKEDITTWFQPIVDARTKKILGWEGLTRGPSVTSLHSATALFAAAHQANMMKPLELMCLKNASKCFSQLQLSGKLFVNISHELLLAGNTLRKQLKALAPKSPTSPNKIVLELTEQAITTDKDKIAEAIQFFHSLGFQIAIDDLGIGKISHEEWMSLAPDYVKISRQFVNNIDKDQDKQSLVRSIVSAAKATHTKVIAHGVESQDELNVLASMGIELCEGYFVQRPELSPTFPDLSHIEFNPSSEREMERTLACDLIYNQEKVSKSTTMLELEELFDFKQDYEALALVEENQIIGLIKRQRFLDARKRKEFSKEAVLGDLDKLIDKEFTEIDSHTSLPELSKTLTGRARSKSHDAFIVSARGKYLGVGSIIDVMRELTSESGR